MALEFIFHVSLVKHHGG